MRDLLGLARAAQGCQRAAKVFVGAEVLLLAGAVAELDNALNLSGYGLGSLAHATAWKRAERGALRLCQCVGEGTDLASVVRAGSVPLQPVSF